MLPPNRILEVVKLKEELRVCARATMQGRTDRLEGDSGLTGKRPGSEFEKRVEISQVGMCPK